MNPAPAPHNFSFSRRLLTGLSAATLLAAVVALGFSSGCSKAPPTDPNNPTTTGPKGDPWKAAASRLKKETNFSATQQALATLTSDMSQQDNEKLPAFTDESFKAVTALVPLSSADREELSGTAFSSHDPVYLADCFYLRDVARSLNLTGLPPEKQAELAFEWVCRQVYLHPWLRPLGKNEFGQDAYEPTALPPTAVLRRGFGSGLERMYVFLALLQQLGLDGCLIGPPDAANWSARFHGPAVKYPTSPDIAVPRGPFFAVGVRAGNDVKLFDPWRSAPLPVTLDQLKKNPDAAKAWFEDKANISGTTFDEAKTATVYLAAPVNSLSPRMAMFDTKLKTELGAKFAYDLKALEAMRGAFPDPKPTFWNPPDEPFAYGRAARSYLPQDMGGSDRTPESGGRLYNTSLRGQIPKSAFTLPAGFGKEAAEAQNRLIMEAAGTLAVAFIEQPNPRERIQRGQFQDAARDVVAKQEAFSRGLERLRMDGEEQQERAIEQWIANINAQYLALGVAQSDKNPQAIDAALKAIEALWRDKTYQIIIDKLSAEVGRAEAALLLALCKHEQAEQMQIRLDRTPAANAKHLQMDTLDAWKTALAAWRTYETMSSAHVGFPGRVEHAKTLSARAAKFAESKKP